MIRGFFCFYRMTFRSIFYLIFSYGKTNDALAIIAALRKNILIEMVVTVEVLPVYFYCFFF